MTTPTYDYHGLLASTWDLWRDDTSQWSDRFFFLDLIRQYGQPVLDLGCGTGRLVLDYLNQGIDIDGLDNSPEMLAICRSKAEKKGLSPTLYQQEMETLELPRTYRTILAPSSAFQLVHDVHKARTALQRCFEYLQPGGAFVTPFSFDWREGEPLETDWGLVFEKVRPEDGAVVRHWTREWRDIDRQLWHAESRFEVDLEGKRIATEEQRRSPEGRWYTQAEVLQLYREVGFVDIQLFKEFTHEPTAPDSRFFSALGVKP